MKTLFTAMMASALLSFGSVAAETNDDVKIVDWMAPDCSVFSSFKQCQNKIKTDYRRMRQKEMKESGLAFWYYERPSFKDEAAAKALKDKVEGMLKFNFDVERDGTTSNVRVIESSSDEAKVYGTPMVDAIKQWTFVPVDSKVSDVEWKVEIYFEAEECKDKPKDGVEKKDCYVK